MKLIAQLNENEIRSILAKYISEQFGIDVAAEDIPILVKSKQNYRSEWEEAQIKIDVTVIR